MSLTYGLYGTICQLSSQLEKYVLIKLLIAALRDQYPSLLTSFLYWLGLFFYN